MTKISPYDAGLVLAVSTRYYIFNSLENSLRSNFFMLSRVPTEGRPLGFFFCSELYMFVAGNKDIVNFGIYY